MKPVDFRNATFDSMHDRLAGQREQVFAAWMGFGPGTTAEVCARADILVAAMGRAALITRDFIKPGATVIDVGTNRISSREEAARIFRNSAAKLAEFDRKGSLLVGDVDPVDVVEVAGAYTPVPGGVGPLTISMLMVNTIEAAERELAKACFA